jgi:hypothetical protein
VEPTPQSPTKAFKLLDFQAHLNKRLANQASANATLDRMAVNE